MLRSSLFHLVPGSCLGAVGFKDVEGMGIRDHIASPLQKASMGSRNPSNPTPPPKKKKEINKRGKPSNEDSPNPKP